MRIIKKGVVPETVPIEATCNHCETVFEFMQHEATRVPDQRDGDFWRVKCPVCGKDVTEAV